MGTAAAAAALGSTVLSQGITLQIVVGARLSTEILRHPGASSAKLLLNINVCHTRGWIQKAMLTV